jgi:hypothetical protein
MEYHTQGKRKSVKSRDQSSHIVDRRKTSYTRRKSRRSETVSKKRKIKYKHILICGHGSLPPDKKGGVSFIPHMNEVDQYLLGMNIKLDETLSSKSRVITGTLPGTSGFVFPDGYHGAGSNIILFKRIKAALENKSLVGIVKDLNDHPNMDGITKSKLSKLAWAIYAKAQPTDFYISDENIIVYFHGMQGGPDFHAGIYDIGSCDVDLDEATFSDVENSKCNISREVFNQLGKPYGEYFTEIVDDSYEEDRSNYYMEATVWGDKMVHPTEINGKKVRPLTVPLKYIEEAIRNHYKDPDLHIIFYSTICKSTPPERRMKKKKKKEKRKKKKEKKKKEKRK